MKKALISGATGFVGKHLTNELEGNGYHVYKTSMSGEGDLIKMNILDFPEVHSTLRRIKPDYIFHLAAIAFVPTSWKEPDFVFETNIMGSLNLFNAIKAVGIDPTIQIAGCYSEDTKAVTRGGLKSYKQIKTGDEVVTINPETERVEYKKVIGVVKQEYNGEMYRFKSRSADLLVSPNHKMLVKKNKGKKLSYTRADEISGRNLLPLGIAKKTIFSKYSPELFYLIGLFIGDGYLVPTKKKLAWSGMTHKEYIKNNRNERGQFVRVNRSKTKIYKSQRAFLAIPQDDKARKKAEFVLNKLGIKYSAYERELYFVPPKRILSIFVQCGKYAKNKTIPLWMLKYSLPYLKELFNGLIDSDGHYRKTGCGYTTISKKLVAPFVILCRLVGKWVTFNKASSRKVWFKTRFIKSKPVYNFNISEGEKELTTGSKENYNVSKEKYSGIIWCLEVEDNHNYLTERNGRVTFCGNSSEEYGLVHPDEVPIKETNPLRPLSPYAVTKIAMDYLGYQYFKSYDMKIVRTRAFNHEGYGRPETYMPSSFSKQFVDIRHQIQTPVIHHGNLEAERDFTDVRDMARAYRLAVEKGEPGEVYNIGSGNRYSAKDILDRLEVITGIQPKRKADPARMRPSDVPVLVSDSSKFIKQTGWKPKYNINDILSEELRYWEENLSK